ncbi:MATE family efflux transporter [Stappia taiwanensis]|uniref:Multidrug-efflux transporter n=1 Tax=Stappia taiwanensis TaxID=992267 RepID=A0A838XZR2_9HYPH|nr:MATE family efflux transporter [Stappia taiwanensis]MBA4612323.1 MATE family efflux transporter [Stappia taiwanensis]GGF04509.1 MATE family efflux transporter [Stappia taiwanensis]
MSWSTPASPGGLSLSDLWRSDIRPTLMLGLPIAGAQVAQMAINTTDVLMIGWLGATELAAAVLAFNLFILIWLFGMGVLQAVIPLAATARGDRRPRDVRRAVRMGIWFAILYTIPSWCVLWFTEDIMLVLGQDREVSALAGDYMQVMMFSILPSLLTMALRNFITVMEKAQVVLWATVAAALMNAGIDYLLIFGHFGFPRLELVGAGIASVATASLTVVVLVIYTLRQRQLRRYAILGRIWRSDWPKMLEILRLGWPVAVTLLVEVALFSGASVMMGWIGTLPLAAHGIAAQLASITFMVPLGLGQAGMIRVGLAAGHRDRAAVGRAGWVALFGAMLFMFCGALVFWSFPEMLVRLFLDLDNPQADEVMAIGITFLLVAAVFQLFDGVQVVGGCVLRGLSDTKVPMVLAILGYWGVGMGLAYGLAFPGGFGGVGIWWGLAAGLASVSVALMWRFAWRERLGLV